MGRRNIKRASKTERGGLSTTGDKTTDGDRHCRCSPKNSVTRKLQSCLQRCSISLQNPNGFENLKEEEEGWLCFI